MIASVQRQKREAGTTLIEFAVILATLLTIMFGIVDIGRALYAYDWVANAARQGTRFAIVRGRNCSGLSGGCPAQGSDVTAYINSLATGIDTAQLTVTSGCYYQGTYLQALPCAPTTSVQVEVQYTFTLLSPLMSRSWTMHSISERVVQN